MTDRAQILVGDALERLRELPDESVHCVVTSPPYWALRDYGTGTWEGGNPECEHRHVNARPDHSSSEMYGTRGEQKWAAAAASPMRGTCNRCGAVRVDAQLGLEDTPEAYVARLVEVFREVRRVLRSDGTAWVNLGDTYIGGRLNVAGLKPKDLVGIPWRAALALQADGWWLRSDVIWHKPNPMPESVRDRPTRAHEYLFLLTKSGEYHYDQQAIAEPATSGPRGSSFITGKTGAAGLARVSKKVRNASGTRNRRSVWRLDEVEGPDVWTIAQEPYPHSHFATFPRALVRPCVLAGCPVDGVVLDPYGGSGTTGEVALALGRRAILIELNPGYLPLIEERLRGVQYPLIAPGALAEAAHG